MNLKENVLARFTGGGSGHPVFMPDLTLWYPWHKSRGTLPEDCRNHTLVQVAQALGAPVWAVERPWRMETVGIDIAVEEKENERIVRYEAPDRTLTERWTLGPDGDWWQLEYPVKEVDDLPAARAVVEARTYEMDASGTAALSDEIGDAGILALEIPMHPYSDMLHTLLGWGEGLLLLTGEGREHLLRMLAILEDKRQEVVSNVAAFPGTVVLAPDNLDGRYLSPGDFRSHFDDSYRRTADVLHDNGKHLVVHVGGPFKHLLPLMAAAGVDGVEGISGPPQGDATIKEAREAAGADLTLWGGIPQDFLVDTYSEEHFERAVREAARQAAGDRRVILGIADRVPVDADFHRIKAAARIIADAVQSIGSNLDL